MLFARWMFPDLGFVPDLCYQGEPCHAYLGFPYTKEVISYCETNYTRILHELTGQLRESGTDVYSTYFRGGSSGWLRPDLPIRTGYYCGYRLVGRLVAERGPDAIPALVSLPAEDIWRELHAL